MEFLAATIVALVMIYRGWMRSGMRWWEFWICRGAYVYARFWHRCSWHPWGAFPAKGPALVVSNHTSSADPTLILGSSLRGLSFVVAREHFNVHPVCHFILKYLDCVPVKRGGADPTALRKALERLRQGYLLVIFPEGGLSGVARNRLLRGKPGMAFLALNADVPVYPMFIAGGTRTDELLKSWVMPSKKSTRMIVGKPVDLTAYRARPRTRALIEEVTELLMRKIAELDPAPGKPEKHQYKVIGQGELASGAPDLGSDKKHLEGFGR